LCGLLLLLANIDCEYVFKIICIVLSQDIILSHVAMNFLSHAALKLWLHNYIMACAWPKLIIQPTTKKIKIAVKSDVKSGGN